MFFLSSIKYKTCTVLFLSFFLSSCLTINSDLRINSNRSGSLNIVYSIDKTLKGISNLGNDDEIVPLNLSEEYIQEIIGDRTDIKYVKYQTSEDDLYYTVDVTFEFESIDALNSVLPTENAIIINKEGSETLFSQGVVTATNEIINNETMEIFKDIYGDHYFKMIVRVPGNIIDVRQGHKQEDRVAEFNKKFIDIIATSDDLSWSIRW